MATQFPRSAIQKVWTRLGRKSLLAVLSTGLIGGGIASFGALSGVASLIARAPEAKACRDCPFPLRVDKGRWLMPNKQLEVQIHEETYDPNSMRVFVILRDARSKEILATGETVRSNFRNNFALQLEDLGGRLVKGQIRWINKADDVIQARFMCQGTCTIQRYFE